MLCCVFVYNMGEKALHFAYYNLDSPAAYSGQRNVYKEAKRHDSSLTWSRAKKWFENQHTATLHKPVRYRFQRNKIIVKAPQEQYQADLCDMRALKSFNSGVNYILTCIDCFTRYAWAIPLKSKGGSEVANALIEILNERKCKRLQTDKGKEFLNSKVRKVLADFNVQFWTTENDDIKAAIVERFNRSLKTRMFKYFTEKETRRYIDILPKLVNAYNNTVHRSIGMKPIEAYRRKLEVMQNLYKRPNQHSKAYKYNVGDTVRISKTRRTFKKGYLPGWTEEVFKISARHQRGAYPLYELEDLLKRPIKNATFYESEIQRVVEPKEFRIEKIIRRSGNRYLVKWRGYSSDFNSWINKSDLRHVGNNSKEKLSTKQRFT